MIIDTCYSINVIKRGDATKYLLFLYLTLVLFPVFSDLFAQSRIKIYPEIAVGYRLVPLPIVETSYYNPSMLFNSDKNLEGFNAILGIKISNFPLQDLNLRYRLHSRYGFLMYNIDYLNLRPTFGGRLIVFEKWGWLFDHRLAISKVFLEKWDVGLGLTFFNAGKENKQNLPPDNSQKWIYSIQINCLDFAVYRRIKNWVDIGLISSYTLNGLPDKRDGKYIIFEIQLSKSFDFSKS